MNLIDRLERAKFDRAEALKAIREAKAKHADGDWWEKLPNGVRGKIYFGHTGELSLDKLIAVVKVLPKDCVAVSKDKAKPIVRTVQADYKDVDSLLIGLAEQLKAFGVHLRDQPDSEGTDEYMLVLSNKQLTRDELRKVK